MWPTASTSTVNQRQRRIRDLEWACTMDMLSSAAPGSFLDVGCGTSYAMEKASQLGFTVAGIDPDAGTFGVSSETSSFNIVAASAESLPFENDSFDVVHSSHALEHFLDHHAGLSEMNRVLAPSGTALLVVPSGTMAAINSLSQLLFTTHIRIGKFLLRTRSGRGLREIFFPPAHGALHKSTFAEIQGFRKKRWQRLISTFLDIDRVILPGLYPYPDFPQFFPFVRSRLLSSSFVFVCHKKRPKQTSN